MKLPHTITVWNRDGKESYTRAVINGVLWEDCRGVQLRKTGVSADNGIFVLIPFESAAPGFSIRAKDWMMRGDIAIEPQSSGELSQAGAVLVAAVDKLDFGGLPHWEVTGR